MRILFLNQYFPPDPAPTGVLFREIADELSGAGHEVDFVDAGEAYRAGQGKGGRMRREVACLRRMLREGKARPRADVVVSGTSPPCLAVVADRVARRHRARHVHWAMDVYPEIAVALGEIGGRSLVAKVAGWLVGRAYRRCDRVVALDADMAARLRGYGVGPACIRPWVSGRMLGADSQDTPTREPWTWIYSGNLGRAHDFETLLLAQQRIERDGLDVRLLFQGGGPGWPLAQARAAELGLRRCEFRDYVAEVDLRGSLMACHAFAVTQRPETQGLLWPSKLGLVMTLPRPVVFVGPVNGAVAAELRALPHAGIVAPGDGESLAAWIKDRREGRGAEPRGVDGAAHRAAALRQWRELIEG